jgi:hypothetical protein
MVDENIRITSVPDASVRLDTVAAGQPVAGEHEQSSFLSWTTWTNFMPGLAREGVLVGDNTTARTAGGGGTTTGDADEQAMLNRLKSTDQNLDQTPFEQSEPHDSRWDNLLNNPAIDRSHSDGTDGQGHQLFERGTDEVHNIEVRRGHQDGDPPANYVIDKDGKVHELIPPDKKAMGEGDDSVVIEIDDSGVTQAQAMNDLQRSSANALIAQIQADAAQAGLAPDIPDSIMRMLVAHDVPAPHAVSRHLGGGMTAAPGAGNGGMAPPQGSYERPPIPSRAPQGEVHQRVEPTNVKFDPSSIHDPAVRAIVDKVVAKNEGHPNSINWNDNGYGISVGIFQWNQKAGELPGLFKAMWDNPAAKQVMIDKFGPDVAQKLGTDESFVRRANFSPNNDLGAHLQATLNDKAVQNVEVQMAAAKVVHLQQVANSKGIHSAAAIGLYVDLVNQLGEGGAAKYINQAAAAGGGEGNKYQTLLACSSENRWRSTRNKTVDKEIKDAGLSLNDFSISA